MDLSNGSANFAKYGEFPWMVAVLDITEVGAASMVILKGGGSLIHPRVVLTVAHNIADCSAKDLIIRAGEYDNQKEIEMYKQEERNVMKIIRHERFIRRNLQNDIAMLLLESNFPMNAAINTVCLPPPDANFNRQKCFTGGWGKDRYGKKGEYQTLLKKVRLPVIRPSTCQEQLRQTRFGADFILFEGFLCAGECFAESFLLIICWLWSSQGGEEGVDSCTGDGGSGLTCEIDSGHYTLAGIVAAGVGCGLPDVPGVYVNVAKYREWIDEKMGLLQLETSFYEFKESKWGGFGQLSQSDTMFRRIYTRKSE